MKLKKKYLIFQVLLTGCLVFLPLSSKAHGGFQKQAGDTTVYIFQNPISPQVGEKIKFTFTLKQGLNKPLADTEVELKLIETFYGDESRDKVILTEKKITDSNGSFEFDYRFEKENYFDIDLAFKDPPTNELVSTGFLIQPRTLASSNMLGLVNGIIIGIIGTVIIKLIYGTRFAKKSHLQ